MSDFLLDNYKIIKKWNGSKNIPYDLSSISTDSRKIVTGNIFIAINGDKFDGFDFIEDVAANGASAVIFDWQESREQLVQDLASKFDCLFIAVENSVKYMGELAHNHIKKWKSKTGGKVLAVCGSNGKTTHKEMLAHLLEAEHGEKVLANRGSFNNNIGVPLTAFDLKDFHELVVFELGTNHPGEISHLCSIVDPDGGILTNIGYEHMEFFHTLEGVFEEEKCFYDYLLQHNKTEPLILNIDDEWLQKLGDYSAAITYGENNGEVRLNLAEDSVELDSEKVKQTLTNNKIVGEINLKNLAAAFLLARHYSKNEQILSKACSSFAPRGNRSELFQKNGRWFFLDAYNANPSSMEASLNSFAKTLEHKSIDLEEALFILADMLELGESSSKWHQSTGQHLNMMGASHCVFIGEFAADFGKGFAKEAYYFESAQQIGHETWNNLVEGKKAVFLKGSRSLQLESILDITEG